MEVDEEVAPPPPPGELSFLWKQISQRIRQLGFLSVQRGQSHSDERGDDEEEMEVDVGGVAVAVVEGIAVLGGCGCTMASFSDLR